MKRTTFRLDPALAAEVDALTPQLRREAWEQDFVRLRSRNSVVEWLLARAVKNAKRRNRMANEEELEVIDTILGGRSSNKEV